MYLDSCHAFQQTFPCHLSTFHFPLFTRSCSPFIFNPFIHSFRIDFRTTYFSPSQDLFLYRKRINIQINALILYLKWECVSWHREVLRNQFFDNLHTSQLSILELRNEKWAKDREREQRSRATTGRMRSRRSPDRLADDSLCVDNLVRTDSSGKFLLLETWT